MSHLSDGKRKLSLKSGSCETIACGSGNTTSFSSFLIHRFCSGAAVGTCCSTLPPIPAMSTSGSALCHGSTTSSGYNSATGASSGCKSAVRNSSPNAASRSGYFFNQRNLSGLHMNGKEGANSASNVGINHCTAGHYSPIKVPFRRTGERLLSGSSIDDLDDYMISSSAPSCILQSPSLLPTFWEPQLRNSRDDSALPYLVPEHNLRKNLYEMSQKHTVVVMVGLPARGKTFVSKKLVRYLNWIGIRSKVFNVGEYRRKRQNQDGGYTSDEFFSNNNKAAIDMRNQCALDALHDLDAWCQQKPGSVAVFDATNSTPDRRKLISNFCERLQLQLLFVELITTEKAMIDANIKEVKITSPDYKHFSDPEDAVADFKRRIAHYEETYVPLEEDLHRDSSYIKLIDCGKTYVVNKIDSHIESKIVYYLMNIHPTTRSFYFTRHGESMLNLEGKIGGDSDLSERGLLYARKLAEYMTSLSLPNLQVWTSQLKRTCQTAQYIDAPKLAWKNLNEIDAGVCEGLTYEEIEEKYPKEFHARDEDKYHYRYPRGESYEDLVARLEPVIMELERSENILVVCHQGVLRCLLAYYLEKAQKDLPYLRCPLHTVFKLTPIAYGCRVEMIKIDVPAVDTHRSGVGNSVLGPELLPVPSSSPTNKEQTQDSTTTSSPT